MLHSKVKANNDTKLWLGYMESRDVNEEMTHFDGRNMVIVYGNKIKDVTEIPYLLIT